MNRTLLKGPWCRREVIRSFPSISNPSIPRRTFLLHPVYSVNDRAFSSVFHLRSEKSSSSSQPSNSVAKDETEAPLQNDSHTPSQHTPWYLQEETPLTDSQPMLSRDQIPDLPEEPPAILPVLLDYVFKDLGLDELKLIDLRGLDTPPALGANVIMIIGTARSVKHLNVSADRLCRWLRSTWKLRPYADGLLGRNELKIKLRRKARRARIASRAGAMVDEKDDGITTGWICVNAGVVEESPVLEEADRSFEGFGQVVGGTRIVVQILTEEKRAEVDLDGLWQATLERAERKKQKFAKERSDVPPEEVRVSTSKNPSSSDHEFGHIPRSSVSLPFEQRRRLHNSRRLEILHPNGDINTSPGDVAAESPASQIKYSARNDPLTAGVTTDSLFQHLSGLSDDQILSELGDGPDDRESTLFLRLFYNGLSKSSAEETAVAQLKLTCTAISRKHPAYSKESLWRAFMACSANCYSLSDELCFQIVSAFLTERPADDQSVKPWLPDSDKELALLVLEHLSVQGVDVLNMKVFNMLYNAAFHARDPSLADRHEKRRDSDGVDPASRVLRLIETLDIPFDSEQMRNHMVSRFRNGDYDGFWKLWRKLPLNGSLRSVADYELLFQLHAELGDELRARDCVSTWVPMMSREDPPIPLQGQLLQYIMYCLVIAEPGIEHAAAEGSTSNLALIWNQCKSKMPMGA